MALQGHGSTQGHVLSFEDATAKRGCLGLAGNPDLVFCALLRALTTVLPGTSRARQLILAQNNCCTSSGVESRQDSTVHLLSSSARKCPRAPGLEGRPCRSISIPFVCEPKLRQLTHGEVELAQLVAGPGGRDVGRQGA